MNLKQRLIIANIVSNIEKLILKFYEDNHVKYEINVYKPQ